MIKYPMIGRYGGFLPHPFLLGGQWGDGNVPNVLVANRIALLGGDTHQLEGLFSVGNFVLGAGRFVVGDEEANLLRSVTQGSNLLGEVGESSINFGVVVGVGHFNVPFGLVDIRTLLFL